ncbi:MAG: protoheme IX farnesyltransferase [Polyangiaceae bacterium]|nr:protoheme IX farnesyltransferase [Polyangiaceae bacterium]
MSAPPTVSSSAPSGGGASAPALAASPGALWELTKPGVTRLVVITTAAGAFAAPGAVEGARLAAALGGTALVVAGANALNQALERETDALMSRTRTRPLPEGRVSAEVAWGFGIVVALAGSALLAVLAGPVAAALAVAALVVYVGAYTPMKRATPLALYVGAVPGALPPLIGWASVTGEVGLGGLALFAILFVWQLPHFLAIATFRRDEYARAGIRVAPVVHGAASTRRQLAAGAAALLLVSLAPPLVGLGGPAYVAVASLTGLAYGALAVYGWLREGGERWARAVFFSSMPHLVALFTTLVLSTRLG